VDEKYGQDMVGTMRMDNWFGEWRSGMECLCCCCNVEWAWEQRDQLRG